MLLSKIVVLKALSWSTNRTLMLTAYLHHVIVDASVDDGFSLSAVAVPVAVSGHRFWSKITHLLEQDRLCHRCTPPILDSVQKEGPVCTEEEVR